MSVDVSTWVWQKSASEGMERMVLLAIAHEAGEDGLAWPSIQQLVEYCRCDRRTVQRGLCAAIERGELKRVLSRDGLHSSTYRFTAVPDGAALATEGAATVSVRGGRHLFPPQSPLSTCTQKETACAPPRVAHTRESEDLVLSAEEQNGSTHKKQARPQSFDQFRTFCLRNELTEIDVRYLWCGWEANGWMNGRYKIRSWKDAVIRQRDGGYVPSRRNGASNGQKHH
jgi:hypothetical protein